MELSLIEAWKEMRKEDPEANFEVVVVDSAPLFEGESEIQSPDVSTHTISSA